MHTEARGMPSSFQRQLTTSPDEERVEGFLVMERPYTSAFVEFSVHPGVRHQKKLRVTQSPRSHESRRSRGGHCGARDRFPHKRCCTSSTSIGKYLVMVREGIGKCYLNTVEELDVKL